MEIQQTQKEEGQSDKGKGAMPASRKFAKPQIARKRMPSVEPQICVFLHLILPHFPLSISILNPIDQ